MDPTADTVLGVGLGTGMGLIWVGLCGVLFVGKMRLCAAGVGGIAAAAGTGLLLSPGLGAGGAATFAVVGAALIAGPEMLRRGAAIFARPWVRWAAAGAVGFAAVGGSAAYYDRAVETEADSVIELVAALNRSPDLAPYPGPLPTTDRGTPVTVKIAAAPRSAAEITKSERSGIGANEISWNLIRTGPADDRTNCHGWVFAGGTAWVGGNFVDAILAENGYRAVTDPRPGDVIVYRRGQSVEHSAVVRYTAATASPLVEGKWGCMGVYLHRPEASGYGSDYTYYRTARTSHTLRGILSAGVPNQ